MTSQPNTRTLPCDCCRNRPAVINDLREEGEHEVHFKTCLACFNLNDSSFFQTMRRVQAEQATAIAHEVGEAVSGEFLSRMYPTEAFVKELVDAFEQVLKRYPQQEMMPPTVKSMVALMRETIELGRRYM